ncbi:carotenoid isomerase [Klebsormidium nitens]|uniref:prolycopene isomerase n=1 Tax=Klebsormidium nitens TaxID=105231 RepID=A0A1Y1HW98_KLENI|nr:carotenoid isomerase [Klebsormidium nitens]|eukprot:GAQ80118.1 carotenoid isomerase [Klebsormidium nitens]
MATSWTRLAKDPFSVATFSSRRSTKSQRSVEAGCAKPCLSDWTQAGVSNVTGVKLLPLNTFLTNAIGLRQKLPKQSSKRRNDVARMAVAAPSKPVQDVDAPEENVLYDAVIIGSGMGGLVTATQLAAKGAKVLLLEKYIVPGGSAAYFEREGYTFDVGSSMMFGFGDQGTTNLLTRALAAVGKKMETIPDPAMVHYHLPDGLSVRVHRDYEEFIAELTSKFPHEKEGIRKFYDDCWKIFNALNSLDLKSLEEPRYLLGEFVKQPLACLTLAYFLPVNTGDVARKYIKDETLLRFIDIEDYAWSTVPASLTPMINSGMVLCDRHYGGVRYPIGGVGGIAQTLADGLEELGGKIAYKANVKRILVENGQASGVRLTDGREYKGKTIISNATRWDTFEKLLEPENMPDAEKKFQTRYRKSPSFLSIHMGVRADALPDDSDVHHMVLEDWSKMEESYGTIFVSMPTMLDKSVAPKDRHIVHAFTPCWIEEWEGLSPADYRQKKEQVADEIVDRLEKGLGFKGLRQATVFREVGTPRTHRKFLAREDGTYGPVPSRRPLGLLGMPFNTTALKGLYCVGDSCFPGQGVNAVAFSGMACAHRVAADIGLEKTIPVLDGAFNKLLSTVRDRV